MGVRRGRHARGLSLIFSRRHIVATSTPLHGHCLVQYCATNSMVRIDWFELLCVLGLAISLERSVAPLLTLPWIVCIVRSVTHYYGIHTMTVTVIRMDQRRVDDIDHPYTQYCIVNTEMNMREFKAYCQIYNLYDSGEIVNGLRGQFPAHIMRDSSWSTEAGAIAQFERWQSADQPYTDDNRTIS